MQAKSVYDLVDERFGVATSFRDDEAELATATTTDAALLRANPNRIALTMVNLGVNPIFVRPGGVAAATAGIRLAPSGGNLTVTMEEDLVLAASAWRCITTGGNAAIYVLTGRITA